MTVTSARDAVFGFGKQTAEGSALSAPKFEIPMGSGFVGPVRETEEFPWTNESQDHVGDYVFRLGGEISVGLPVLPITIAGLLELVLGSRSSSGSNPYTHAITPADTLPFATMFYKQPGGNYWTLADAKVGSLEIGFEAGRPLSVEIAGIGKTVARADTKWSAATVSDEAVDPFYTMIGVTTKLDIAATPATTQLRSVQRGRFSINRNIDPIQTDGFGYQYMAEQKRDIEVSLDGVVFESNDIINTIFTGTTSGTALSSNLPIGSLKFTFLGSDQAAAATRSLDIALPHVQWTVAQIPEADPAGQTLTYDLVGKVSKPASGASITATAINATTGASY